jgi:hypothetical protein
VHAADHWFAPRDGKALAGYGYGQRVRTRPVAVFNASPRATFAQASLTEILKTMGSRIVEEACITVPLLGKHLDPEGIVADAAIANSLRTAVRVLTQAINAMKV